MKNFSIKELETLCGIKAHTIRIWEHRHSVFQPQRTDGNARRYSLEELSKVLKLALLNKCGHKISNISKLTADSLEEKLESLIKDEQRIQKAITQLIMCMYRMDTEGFERILNDCYLTWPVETVIDCIIFPFLEKVGLLCQGKQLNEEHLVVTAIRKKLLCSIERTDAERLNGKTALLFLSGERQLDLMLLYLYYHLKKNGCEVIYMGADISIRNLEEMLSIKKADFLVTYLSKKSSLSLDMLSVKMKHAAPQSLLFLLNTASEIKFDNIRCTSVDELLSLCFAKKLVEIQ